jgi:poly-gamma-glutamate synthesis protein (capsule biosynthesis protein)
MARAGTTVNAISGTAATVAADAKHRPRELTLFVCGDVMTGRGVDQILPHPGPPELFETYIESALAYVELAANVSGPIARPVPFDYVWGDALGELDRVQPDARIVNLETAVTTSDEAWPGKAVHYRMHPRNVPCLSAAAIDCCNLANNHALDWGRSGLAETLDTLRAAGIRTAGAGAEAKVAAAPAVIDSAASGRVLVFGFGTADSGVPSGWRATDKRSGVQLIDDFAARGIAAIANQIAAYARDGDLIVASIHWGGNWGYEITQHHRRFAHGLIDSAGVHLVHGHSSHHPKGIEVYRGRPILYGCGDLLNDYEGISGNEGYRGDLGLMYFLRFDARSSTLKRLWMTPTRMRQLRINRAPEEAGAWLADTLDRECRKLGARVERLTDGTLELKWSEAGTEATS